MFSRGMGLSIAQSLKGTVLADIIVRKPVESPTDQGRTVLRSSHDCQNFSHGERSRTPCKQKSDATSGITRFASRLRTAGLRCSPAFLPGWHDGGIRTLDLFSRVSAGRRVILCRADESPAHGPIGTKGRLLASRERTPRQRGNPPPPMDRGSNRQRISGDAIVKILARARRITTGDDSFDA